MRKTVAQLHQYTSGPATGPEGQGREARERKLAASRLPGRQKCVGIIRAGMVVRAIFSSIKRIIQRNCALLTATAVVGGVWVASVHNADTFLLSRHGVAVGSWRQRMVFAKRSPSGGGWHVPAGIHSEFFLDAALIHNRLNPDETYSDWDWDFDADLATFHRTFAGVIVATYSYHDETVWGLAIPYWPFFLALLAVASRRTTVHWMRRRRALSGRCVVCDYDLRATPGRCPECGTDAGRKKGDKYIY